ncbi:MAG: hypothetical protein N3B12_01435, partial [Armatimonadetes bacterium]|nr:hypothetical protein [Armatimonadota bacterium]
DVYKRQPYNKTPIYLGAEGVGAIIANNEFYGPLNVENRAKGRVVIESNIAETATDPFPKSEPAQK